MTLRAPGSGGARPGDTSPLVRAALARAGLPQLAVEMESDFPIGAGLGGSSAAGVALAAALAGWRGDSPAPGALAEWSRAVECEDLGIAGGRQDHYAAAFGGALGLTFGRETEVTPLPLDAATRTAIEERCLVYYTGESRISGETIQAVLDQYTGGVPATVFALDRMGTLARLMATALSMGDLDALGALVGEHWMHQRTLHPGITTARIDTLIATALGAGALGGKPLGASGGGCVVLIAPADRTHDVLAATAGLGERLPFRVATEGVRVESRR